VLAEQVRMISGSLSSQALPHELSRLILRKQILTRMEGNFIIAVFGEGHITILHVDGNLLRWKRLPYRHTITMQSERTNVGTLRILFTARGRDIKRNCKKSRSDKSAILKEFKKDIKRGGLEGRDEVLREGQKSLPYPSETCFEGE